MVKALAAALEAPAEERHGTITTLGVGAGNLATVIRRSLITSRHSQTLPNRSSVRRTLEILLVARPALETTTQRGT